jgi:hypothetical protein
VTINRSVYMSLLIAQCGLNLMCQNVTPPIRAKILEGGTLEYGKSSGSFSRVGERRYVMIVGTGKSPPPWSSDMPQNDLVLTLRLPARTMETVDVGEGALEGFAFLTGDHIFKVWQLTSGEARIKTEGHGLSITANLRLRCTYYRGRSPDQASSSSDEEVDLDSVIARADPTMAQRMFEPVLVKFAPALTAWKEDFDHDEAEGEVSQ